MKTPEPKFSKHIFKAWGNFSPKPLILFDVELMASMITQICKIISSISKNKSPALFFLSLITFLTWGACYVFVALASLARKRVRDYLLPYGDTYKPYWMVCVLFSDNLQSLEEFFYQDCFSLFDDIVNLESCSYVLLSDSQLPKCLYVLLSDCLFTHLFIICPAAWLSVCPTVYMSCYQTVCLPNCSYVLLLLSYYLIVYMSCCLTLCFLNSLYILLLDCLFAQLFICLPDLFAHMFTLSCCLTLCLPYSLYVLLSDCLFAQLFICLAVGLFVCQLFKLSCCWTICLPKCLYVPPFDYNCP